HAELPGGLALALGVVARHVGRDEARRACVDVELRMLARDDDRVEVRARLREAVDRAVPEALRGERRRIPGDRDALVDERAEARPGGLGVEEEALPFGAALGDEQRTGRGRDVDDS